MPMTGQDDGRLENDRRRRAHPAQIFFAFGLRGRYAVTCEPICPLERRRKRHFRPQNREALVSRKIARQHWLACRSVAASHRRISELVDSVQLTQTSPLASFRLYRGFESIPLRHAVWTAEKFRRPLLRNTRTVPDFRDISSRTWTGENALLGSEGDTVLVSLWRLHAQSGFREGLRRMERDQKLGI